SIVTHGRARARMMEHAIRVASEAASERIPHLIGAWTEHHPALARRDPADMIADGTEPLVTGPGAVG
ncbi:MAG TPA: hypothetical protein VII26_00730, partial [Candidatus Limnocylindria bacterium]